MINKILKNKNLLLELSIIFTITLIFNLLFSVLTHDEIWSYGFSYNIASGLIPYKDFNMVITPFFPIIGALFMLIFGKNIIIYHIFNAIICTSIFYYMKKFTPKGYYLAYEILLFYAFPNYNLFCILLLYILMNLENKKSSDYLIGLMLGITFITKQNVGIYLCIPTLFIKDKKKILKRIIGFIIPNIFLLIYLLINNCLYEFIDYTILGIGSFIEKNTEIYPVCLIFIITSIIFLIYKYLKTKEIKTIYLLSFIGLSYPLIEPYHTMIAVIPIFNYFLNELKLNKKIITSVFIVFIIFITSLNIYQYSTEKYSYPNNTNEYKYKKIDNDVVTSITIIKEFIEKTKGKVFVIDMYAYAIKLEMNRPIDKFDLLNDGNLGKNGHEKIINEMEEICQKEKCTFLLNGIEVNNPDYSQYNQDIYNYIVKSYTLRGNMIGLSVYTN